MDCTCFTLTIEDKIAHLTLSRPEKRNSMIPVFWDELPRIVRHIDEETDARVIVISSTGPHFSSGMDVAVFAGQDESGMDESAREMARRQHPTKTYQDILYLQDTFSCLENCRLPVLAAIQGGAIGGAVDFITACDMRYMTADGFFNIHEINIGMTADVGTFPRICRLLPEGIVRELAYTGRRMGAEEAKSLGFVNQVFDSQQAMLDAVMGVARDIATKAPLAVYGSKRIINYARDHSTKDTLDYMALLNAGNLQRAEIAEAFAANAEKREGDFAELPSPRRQMGSDVID